MCPIDHPFIPVSNLEAEAIKLLESVIAMLYNNLYALLPMLLDSTPDSPLLGCGRNPDVLSAILNSWSNLVKLRPPLVQIVVSALTSWHPTTLAGAGLPYASIKSVEKSVRILLLHISRQVFLGSCNPFTSSIVDVVCPLEHHMALPSCNKLMRRSRYKLHA